MPVTIPDPIPAIPKVHQPRKLTGRVVDVLLASKPGRHAFQSASQPQLTFDFEGIVDNRHRGWTRPADARVPYLKRGVVMRNTRQVTMVSVEDLAEIARRLEIPTCTAACLGANIVVEGIANFSFLPRGAKLILSGELILTIEDQNEPCTQTGEALQQSHPERDDLRLKFPKHAVGLRGMLATVERPGTLVPNTDVTVRLPKQWIYGSS
jgi:hypothetical protein